MTKPILSQKLIPIKLLSTAALITLSLNFIAQADEDAKVKLQPLHFGAVQEFGMFNKGVVISNGENITNEYIDHFGSYISQNASIGERLDLEIGIGGVFQFPKEEKVDQEFGGSQYKMFFIGPTAAKAMYHFGNVEHPIFSLGGGLFSYKYNPDASNLGEYLFRAGAYPNYIMTGGLTNIGDNAGHLQGFLGNFHLNNLSLDLMFTTETNLPPLYDWSAAFIASYKVGDGLLELGAGANWKRILSIDPDKTQKKEKNNAYFTYNGTSYSGDPRYYKMQVNFWNRKLGQAITASDSALYQSKSKYFSDLIDTLGLVDVSQDQMPQATADFLIKHPDAQFYTPEAIILMARASLDLKKLINSDWFGANDLRLYAESAILGVKNYPVFYDKVTERIPVMVGFNFPTFRMLDLLSVQYEYFNSPNQNNTYQLGKSNYATPYFPEGGSSIFSEAEYNDITTKDNHSWSILAQKNLLGSLTVSGQIARDHLRTVGTNWFYGSRLEPTEILHKSSYWYWMFQLSWGI